MNSDYKNFKGYLKKKSPNVLVGWQKRFFRVVDGKVIVYSEKESDLKPKGHFQISQISKAIPIDKKILQFNLDGREFDLQAEDEETRDKWIKVINSLIDENMGLSGKKTLPSPNQPGEYPSKRSHTFSSANKIDNLDKATLDLLKNHGLMNNEESTLCKDLLEKKGINKLLNFKDPKIESRIHYGFLFKHHKSRDIFQKRWFFIFSPRPLTNEKYEFDEVSLDEKKKKEWLRYDSLFYFKYEKENASCTKSQGYLDLSLSHKIESVEKDGKFYLILDVEDRVYEFYSMIKGERDKWFEILKNSRRTAKEYQASITKRPRNVQMLANILSKDGPGKLKERLEEEKSKITGDYSKIKDYETLSFTLTNLENEIECTVDGCIVNNPPKNELLIAYTENMHSTLLLIIQKFWDKNYNDIDSLNIIKLASNLYSFEDRLHKLRVVDPNFSKNAKELVKIYMKKQYKNILDVIGNILKMEREKKSIKGDNGYLITNAPMDLFNILIKSFDSIKQFLHKYIQTQMLNTFHECIIQYLIGVDCVISNYNIQVEKEFLLAIANNSEKINYLLNNSLIEDFRNTKLLSDKEINEALRFNQLMSSINLMTQNSISRFVNDMSENLEKAFQDNFLSLYVTKIVITTNDIFGKYNASMSPFIKKKCWEEILKLTVFYYIRSLLTTAHKKVKKVEELINKLNDDKGLLFETYENFVGQNLTETNLKIISDVIDFLNISSFMISSSCLTLREYMGPSFNLSMAKAFINLRCDFTSEEKKDAVNQCKEVLEKCTDKGTKGAGGFFSKMQQDIQNEIEEDENGLDQVVDENEKEKQTQTVVLSLNDFLNNEENEDEDEEEKEEQNQNNIIKEEIEENEISDVVYEGVMKKKSYSKWQERFFQLKNGYLYWFKDKNSAIIQNKISIHDTLKIESHKECKFIILSKEVEKDKEKKKEKGKDKDKDTSSKVYKFSVENESKKQEWITALTSEMKRLKGQEYKSHEILLEIKTKKKVISDLYKLPEVGKDRNGLKEKVNESINQENYFKPVIKKELLMNINMNNIFNRKITVDEHKPLVTTNSSSEPKPTNKNRSATSADSPYPIEQFNVDVGEDDDADDKNHSSSSFTSCWSSFLLIFKKKN